MSPALVGVAGIVTLLCTLFFLGMPVGFAMGIVGFCGFSYMISFSAGLNMIGSALWSTFSQYGLTVIPLFIFMGQIAFYSGVNEKLYHAAYKWVGHIRGGIAMATVLACSAFAAICGSNAATAATMSTVALPQMKRYHYNDKLSTGAVACGSTLGVVIPPSVVLIVIGLSTKQSIAKLFYGGFGAGIVLAVLLMLTVYIVCTIHPDWGPVGPKTGFKEKFIALSGAFEMALLFSLVMLGLYFGFFTPTEAGAAGSFFAVVICMVQRRLTWKGFVAAVGDTLRISCMVIVIVAGAVIFGRFLAVTRIPYDMATWVVGLPVPNIVIMMVIFLIYIIGGAVMDSLALLLITIPIFFPVASKLGYDPIWFGVTITVITTLGAVTPPVGATTYVVGGMAAGIPLSDVFKGVTFFLPAYIICLIILIGFPEIVTFLPNLLNRIP
ncbi:TRAP transporter large permease [Thermodesulfobacteriota bacterium]